MNGLGLGKARSVNLIPVNARHTARSLAKDLAGQRGALAQPSAYPLSDWRTHGPRALHIAQHFLNSANSFLLDDVNRDDN